MFQLAHIPLSFLPAFLAQVMKKPAAPLGRMAGLEKWDRKMFQPLDMDVGHPPKIGRSWRQFMWSSGKKLKETHPTYMNHQNLCGWFLCREGINGYKWINLFRCGLLPASPLRKGKAKAKAKGKAAAPVEEEEAVSGSGGWEWPKGRNGGFLSHGGTLK